MLSPGETFGRYTIEGCLGRGGMGVVYRAHDAALDRRVALKILTTVSADGRARLLREARAAAALDHPNSVAIFEIDEAAGAPFIAMELVSGRTLRAAMAEAPAPLGVRLGWLAGAARALAAAHARGLVHRDVKPENVMVRDDGVVKVLDFGIARRVAGVVDPGASTDAPALPTLTREGVQIGTPIYMAPEHVRGAAVDGRADQFAWGVLAYELCAGRLPWRGGGDALAVIASALTDEPDPAPLAAAGVPEHVRAVILRALAKRPEQRFASMDEALSALEARGSAVPADAPPAPRYATEEVRAILARAVELQAEKRPDTRLSFDDLLAAAREVGIDTETLREASRAQAPRVEVETADEADTDEPAPDAAVWLHRKRRAFYRHLGVWLVFNAVMFVIGVMRNKLPNIFVPGLFWAIPLAMQGIFALTANRDDAPAVTRRRRREELPARAVEEEAARLVLTGEAARQRVAAPPPVRARVTGSAGEQEAEGEAADALDARPAARQRR